MAHPASQLTCTLVATLAAVPSTSRQNPAHPYSLPPTVNTKCSPANNHVNRPFTCTPPQMWAVLSKMRGCLGGCRSGPFQWGCEKTGLRNGRATCMDSADERRSERLLGCCILLLREKGLSLLDILASHGCGLGHCQPSQRQPSVVAGRDLTVTRKGPTSSRLQVVAVLGQYSAGARPRRFDLRARPSKNSCCQNNRTTRQSRNSVLMRISSRLSQTSKRSPTTGFNGAGETQLCFTAGHTLKMTQRPATARCKSGERWYAREKGPLINSPFTAHNATHSLLNKEIEESKDLGVPASSFLEGPDERTGGGGREVEISPAMTRYPEIRWFSFQGLQWQLTEKHQLTV